jgi:hypothetical protein
MKMRLGTSAKSIFFMPCKGLIRLAQGAASLTLGWFMKPLQGNKMQRLRGTKTGLAGLP